MKYEASQRKQGKKKRWIKGTKGRVGEKAKKKTWKKEKKER